MTSASSGDEYAVGMAGEFPVLVAQAIFGERAWYVSKLVPVIIVVCVQDEVRRVLREIELSLRGIRYRGFMFSEELGWAVVVGNVIFDLLADGDRATGWTWILGC